MTQEMNCLASGGGGYTQSKSDISNPDNNGKVTITGLTGKPKVLSATLHLSNGAIIECYYNESISTNTYERTLMYNGSKTQNLSEPLVDDVSVSGISEMVDGGFKISPTAYASNITNVCYVALA